MEDEQSLEHRRVPGLGGLELMAASGCTRRWRLLHERYVVVTGVAGASEWRHRGRDHLQSRGGMMLLQPGDVHEDRRILAPTAFKVLFIDTELAQSVLGEPEGADRLPRLRHAQASDPALWRLASRIHGLTESGADAAAVEAVFTELLGQLFDRHAAPGATQACVATPGIRQARDYIDAHWNTAVTLEALAAIAGLGRYRLLRSFQACYGLPPHAFQLQLRIERSRRALRHGEPIAQVALDAGFSDQSHFTLAFRRATGITPGRYAAL